MMRVHRTVIEAKPFRIRRPEQFRILTSRRGTRITLLEEIDLSFARGDFNEFRCIPTDVRPFFVWRNWGLLLCRKWGLLRIGNTVADCAHDDDAKSAKRFYCSLAFFLSGQTSCRNTLILSSVSLLFSATELLASRFFNHAIWSCLTFANSDSESTK